MPALYPLPNACGNSDQALAIRRQVAELARQTEALAETARKLAAQVTELVERPVVRAQALSIDAAAESLSLSRNGVYHLLTTGQLVSAKVGTRRLIPLAAIDAFLATATATTTDERAG